MVKVWCTALYCTLVKSMGSNGKKRVDIAQLSWDNYYYAYSVCEFSFCSLFLTEYLQQKAHMMFTSERETLARRLWRMSRKRNLQLPHQTLLLYCFNTHHLNIFQMRYSMFIDIFSSLCFFIEDYMEKFSYL